MLKPKKIFAGGRSRSNIYDRCQTPGYALDPIVPFIKKEWRIWEPACGDGMMVDSLRSRGYEVIGSDILTGENFFLEDRTDWDCIITNPPYSIKYDWLKECYKKQKPFALLIPVETLGAGKAQRMFNECETEIIFLSRRVNFVMPNKGLTGGGAQFAVAWFTWGLSIGKQMSFVELNNKHAQE